jgi:hypothetical protein
MINISVANTSVKEVDHGDPLFTINTGLTIAQRAGIKINTNCPAEYSYMIVRAVERGWIEPVAYVTDQEYMIMKLST